MAVLGILAKAHLTFPSSQLILTPHQKEWERLSGIVLDHQNTEATARALSAFPQRTILVEKVQRLVSGKLVSLNIISYRLRSIKQLVGWDTLAG